MEWANRMLGQRDIASKALAALCQQGRNLIIGETLSYLTLPAIDTLSSRMAQQDYLITAIMGDQFKSAAPAKSLGKVLNSPPKQEILFLPHKLLEHAFTPFWPNYIVSKEHFIATAPQNPNDDHFNYSGMYCNVAPACEEVYRHCLEWFEEVRYLSDFSNAPKAPAFVQILNEELLEHNLNPLVEEYSGKFIVIGDGRIVGSGSTAENAEKVEEPVSTLHKLLWKVERA